MRASHFLLATQKETPADAVVISHQLMLRAGLIRKAASGLYVWLPLGLKVLRRVEQVVREEMDRAGAQEVLMPVVQPAELWRESGRWDQFGPELTRFTDRHDNPFCLGPTHEEVITDLARGELKSYRQLPVNFYQIQTKFRDEVRPRFGVMRAREFIMKDAYSFHVDAASMQATYEVMYRAYSAIFTRLGLQFRAVLADTGAIGGSASHEFHVLADSGEDAIAFSTGSEFAANIEMAEALPPPAETSAPAELIEVPTPGVASIAEAAAALGLEPARLVKTLVVYGAADEAGQRPLVALVLRGDHTLNEVKAGKLPELGGAVQFASEADIRAALNVGPGSIGPRGLQLTVLVDHAARALANFACGANRDGAHLKNVNWERDASCSRAVDLRNVERGDPSPDGHGQLEIKRGIEVGHIFQLGDKYSKAMGMQVLGEDGRQLTPLMGCYGIGVSRIVAAAIEQNHDARGIIWPDAIAPFQVALVPVNLQKSAAVSEACEAIYTTLREAGVEVLFMDDPKARLGVMLADVELIGIPHRIVVGERGLANGEVEYQHRRAEAAINIKTADVLATIAAHRA